jgi:HSP20 family protein
MREQDKEQEEQSREPAVWRDPFADIARLRSWSPFQRLFGDFEERSPQVYGWAPAVDVAECGDSYCITVELPGAKRDDVSLEIHGDMLEVRGHKRNEREEKDERRRIVERSYGSFSRHFVLPANADRGKIDASFKNGVLTIVIPKSEESKPRQVDIKAA